MNNAMEFVRKMPLPQEIKRDYPANAQMQSVKEARDREISDVLTGKDSRLLLIIGPCSADREDAVLEYMGRLAEINRQAAEMADCAVEVVYSVPVALKGELPCV